MSPWMDRSYDSAVGPDLAAAAGERADVPHLDHGSGEVALEGGRVVGVGDHLHGGVPVAEQRLVGGEQAPVGHDALVEPFVEGVGGDGVHGHQRPRRSGRAALLRQLRHVAGVHGRVLRRRGRRLQAAAEGAAVRAADGVRAGQGHQVLLAEPLGGEDLGELVHVGGRGRQVAARVLRPRHAPVPPPRGHLVRVPAGQRDAVPGSEGEDVGAGDDAEAGLLHPRLDPVDHLEPAQARVGPGVLLRRVALGGVDQHRRLAAAHEAVVEVEPEEARREARVAGHRLAHLLLHDDLRRRARAVVEPHPQLRAHPRRRRHDQHHVGEYHRRRLDQAHRAAPSHLDLHCR
uniref:Uncharacterized protein n=1 Tax=Triticum urartu TaxID=4572 RepID=A0A8R7K0I0_TRIUA